MADPYDLSKSHYINKWALQKRGVGASSTTKRANHVHNIFQCSKIESRGILAQ